MTNRAEGFDRKARYAGLLENPFISTVQRNILDYGRWQGIARVIRGLKARNVLDVGCGLGEHSQACPESYVGIDNSAPRIFYAGRRYPRGSFILGDGLGLPVKPRSFDLVMLLDTAHHLSDQELCSVIGSLAAASRSRVLVSDPVIYEGQSGPSRLVYELDRGAMFRSEARLKELILSCSGLELERVENFTTFPGLYRRAAVLLKIK